MIYLQTFLQRSKGELIRNIHQEIKADHMHCKGDWNELVKSDFKKYGVILTEDKIRD